MQENGKQVTVKMTARRAYRTEPIWQYDVGHELIFDGFDGLPETFEVHYSQSVLGEAVTQIGQDGVCTLPDMYAQTSGTIYAWLYVADEETGLTKFSVEIPVLRRPQVTDQEPTPVEQSAIDQAIAALNDGVTRSETAAEAAESAQAAAEGYAESAGDSAITATDAGRAAAAAQEAAETAARAAGTSATDAEASRQGADLSATNAGVSERAAKASETAAAGSASAAAGSASAAAGSASQAAGYASTASDNARAAAGSASAADTSAQAAAGSAADSQQSAQAAAAIASGAAASAAAADGSATEAAGSASAAAGSASAAAGSATAAAGSAQQAAQTVAGIEAAGAAQVAAIEAKGAEVIDSIPADYSDLDADVSDLKSALNGMSTATTEDEGKALKAKTVTDGKVTEWEFGETGSQADSTLSPTSENPVQNKVLYGELNFLTSVGDDTTYINAGSETPSGYSGYTISVDVPVDGVVTLKAVDVCVKTGVTAKLGKWTYRPYSESSPNRGYLTLVEAIDSVVAVDNHAVFSLNNYEYNKNDCILLVTTASNAIGYHLNVTNTIKALFDSSDNGYNSTEVGNENSIIITYPPNGTIQGAFSVTYSQGGSVIATPVKSVVQTLCDDVNEINTATAEDEGKFLKVKTVGNGRVSEWEFGEGGSQITVDSEISETSENPVQNKTLYNELNIVKAETIVPTDTTWKNGEAVQPQIYNGWFTVVYVNETDAVKLKKLDIFATTGTSVRLGIWEFSPYSEQLQTRGYLSLKSILGTVTSENNHAVFTLNSIDFDPETELLGVAASSGGIGCNTGVVNGFTPTWLNSDYGFYDAEVGEQNSLIIDKPGRTESTSGTVQGNYLITYQLAESKTITTTTNVKTAVDKLLDDVDELKNQSDPIANEMLRAPINKYFVVIVDDVTRDALTVADQLLDIGVRPAFALKMETMGVDISWAEVKKLQDMGFEICFHGMLHSRYHPETAPADDAVMIADIAEYKALCKEHGIVLHGYAGPVHYPLPVGAFKEFEWARYPYGLQAYGAPNHLATTFASVSVYSADVVNNQVPVADLIAGANNVGDNQYLTPMLHCQNLVAYLNDYLTVFNSWINAGLTPLRPMDAVKQSLFNSGGIGNNSTFEIQAGTATNPYYLIAGNGAIMHNP